MSYQFPGSTQKFDTHQRIDNGSFFMCHVQRLNRGRFFFVYVSATNVNVVFDTECDTYPLIGNSNLQSNLAQFPSSIFFSFLVLEECRLNYVCHRFLPL